MVAIRPLLPDESSSNTLAMFGSRELSYTAVPLQKIRARKPPSFQAGDEAPSPSLGEGEEPL